MEIDAHSSKNHKDITKTNVLQTSRENNVQLFPLILCEVEETGTVE